MKLSHFLVAFSFVFLAGCVTQSASRAPSSMEEVALAVRTSRDEFKKMTRFTGPDIAVGTFDTLFLRAWKPDGQPTRYQIYVADYYDGEWRFYSSANDSNGTRMDVTLIDRKVGSCSRYGGCSHFEHLALNVSREYLEAAVTTGISFQLSGKAGEQVFNVPPMHVAGFLASVAK